ncbi:hypothetical protein [uncultured Helicobacter sp.]|uniref:hypothetical protein n=1 Tax=uncultured Helicobacter sp. TaxID=175537 RepID=UPI00260F7B81|nr:hypothetical protein [uncultured Helicobacter sp.]
MAEKITFAEFKLTVNEKTQIAQLDLFENKQEDYYELDDVSYIVNCEIIDRQYFWIYVRYGKAKPYSDEILNVDTKSISQNKRDPNEVEPRHQLFCIYIPSRETLYMSNFKKNTFLATYLKDRFKKDFSIQRYYIDEKDFVKEIISVQSLKFTAAQNLFNSGIFEEINDVSGYGQSISFTLEVKIKDHKFDPKKCLDFLIFWKNKKEKQEIDKMICIGKDDKGVEKLFNLDTYLKKIQIVATKNENEMYNPQVIKENLLEKLNAK